MVQGVSYLEPNWEKNQRKGAIANAEDGEVRLRDGLRATTAIVDPEYLITRRDMI